MNIRKSNSSKNWLLRQENDYYVKQAKKQGYRSRAAFKLLEIQGKFHILKKGSRVLELGAAPGSWAQIISALVLDEKASQPQIFAIDLISIEKIKGVSFLLKDCNTLSEQDYEQIGYVDLLLSDMAPSTTGHSTVDHQRSMQLMLSAFNISQKALKIGGHFVAKIFQGKELESFVQGDLSKTFSKVYRFKPKSSRKESSEIYLVALEKKQI